MYLPLIWTKCPDNDADVFHAIKRDLVRKVDQVYTLLMEQTDQNFVWVQLATTQVDLYFCEK